MNVDTVGSILEYGGGDDGPPEGVVGSHSMLPYSFSGFFSESPDFLVVESGGGDVGGLVRSSDESWSYGGSSSSSGRSSMVPFVNLASGVL